MKSWKGMALGVFLTLAFISFIAAYTGLSGLQFDGTQYPELKFGNGEYISNTVDGTLDFGAANLTTTGTLNASGALTSAGASFVMSASQGYVNVDNIRLGYSTPDSENVYSAVRIKVYNKQTGGTDVAAKDVCQWDTVAVEIAADTTKNAKARITNNVMFDCFAWVRAIRPATTNKDSIWVYGKDPAGNSILEMLYGVNGSDQIVYSNNLYSDVDSIRVGVGANTGDFQFDGLYYNAVMASAGAYETLAGVASSAIGDSGGTGWLVIQGFARATVDAATLNAKQGSLLVGASGGDAVTIVAATADSTKNGKILGFAMQPGDKDNTAILIYVDRR